jgi:hypothetical protein
MTKVLKFDEFLNEVQMTFDKLTFYHGCSNSENCEKAIKDGFLKPGNEDIKRGHKLTPEKGFVYMAQSLRHAIIYTIGSGRLGSDISDDIKKYGQYGYLFIIDNNSLKNVDPDEDFVGNLIYACSQKDGYLEDEIATENFQKKWDQNKKQQYLEIAKSLLTPRQYQKCLDYDDYADFAVAGKKMNKTLNDYWKKQIIDLGVPIANYGNTKFKEVWKFDKSLNPKLKHDISNFFDLAEKIEL